MDLLGEPAGIVSLEELWQDATVLERGGVEVRVASVPALSAVKRAAGRSKDKVHLMEPEQMQKQIAAAQ